MSDVIVNLSIYLSIYLSICSCIQNFSFMNDLCGRRETVNEQEQNCDLCSMSMQEKRAGQKVRNEQELERKRLTVL